MVIRAPTQCILICVLLLGTTPAASQPDQKPAAQESHGNRVIITQIHGSIERTLNGFDHNAGSAVAAQVARLLRWRGDMVRDVHPGDHLRLVYEPKEPPELVAMVFEGQAITLEAYRFRDMDNVQRYYDRRGHLIEPGLKNSPLPGAQQITETVQSGRGKRHHQGLDLKAPEGTPIRLPFDGKVSRVNWSTRVNGNCIEIYYTNGKIGRFLHLSHIGDGIVEGVKLSAGKLLGTVGNTGRSSAPHLHYEVRSKRFDVLDPLIVHGTYSPRLPVALRKAFRAARITLAEAMGTLGPSPIEGANVSSPLGDRSFATIDAEAPHLPPQETE